MDFYYEWKSLQVHKVDGSPKGWKSLQIHKVDGSPKGYKSTKWTDHLKGEKVYKSAKWTDHLMGKINWSPQSGRITQRLKVIYKLHKVEDYLYVTQKKDG